MTRIIIAAALLLALSSATSAETIGSNRANESDLLDGRYGAPIALPAAEDAARMERIRKALHADDGTGGRVNPGNDGYGIGQGRCVQHPDWRGCGEAHGR